MRGKKAKAIRKDVYGDMATRSGKYKARSPIHKKMWDGTVIAVTGQIIANSLRQGYQKAKGRGRYDV